MEIQKIQICTGKATGRVSFPPQMHQRKLVLCHKLWVAKSKQCILAMVQKWSVQPLPAVSFPTACICSWTKLSQCNDFPVLGIDTLDFGFLSPLFDQSGAGKWG